MNIRKFIQYTLCAIFATAFISCQKTESVKSEVVEFTVRQKEISYNNAIINVKHNGPEDITWYGFLTDDVTAQEFKLIYSKRNELVKKGKIADLKRETERNILLENLNEDTAYKYIVFGLTPEGELYDNVGFGSVKFTTSKNIYVLTQTEDWTITRLGRNEDKTKEIIEIKANKGGRFAWHYISKESIEEFDKEYPNGFELWEDDIYMTTVNGIELYALNQISTIQYYISQGYKAADLTYIYEEGKPFEVDRLSSGSYYIIVYGFGGDGQHTQKYAYKEITIEEETAEDAYTQWIGNYTFSGEVEVTEDNGETRRETRTYNLRIEDYDNNFMFRIHGWECGEDVKYDWEEDIMQLDKSKNQFLAFPAYYRGGSLEIRESPMTYITFDGAQQLILGIYGYAYNKEQGGEIPVILDGKPMASALPIEEGSNTTVLNGLKGTYETNGQTVEWDYCKMGYIAYSESSMVWQTINPPMRFPITITKVESGEAKMALPQSTNTLKPFSIQRITDDVIRKDYSRLQKTKPETFKQIIY